MSGVARLIGASMTLVSVALAQPATQRVHRINSKFLNEEKVIRVSLPANYSVARRRYPVIYLLDGHVRAFFDMTVASASYGISGDPRDYAIPPQIVVAVEHRDRSADLGRSADQFMRYLTEEVVPLVEKEYRTSPQRILIGHSLGGRFVLMASCRAPGFFPSVIALSPGGGDSSSMRTLSGCFHADWAKANGALRQVFLTAGEREARNDESTKRLRDFLRDSAPPNVRSTYLPGPDLAHTETPYFGIPAGVKFVHDRHTWEMPEAMSDSLIKGRGDPADIMTRWYATLSKRVGFTVPPSDKWLDLATLGYVQRGEKQKAEQMARRLVDEYPENLFGYGRLADIQQSTSDNAGAIKTLEASLRVLDRLDGYDEAERLLQRKLIRAAIDKLKAAP